METESERGVEQIIDVPMPQIVEEIVEVEQIVDVPAPQIELVFCFNPFFFCAVSWSVAHFFEFTSLDLAVSMSD